MSQWTKKAIMECFSRQIETTPLDRITVKGIVAECGVTRNTFYYHFEDIFALAKEVLRERLEQISDTALNSGNWETFLALLARQVNQNPRSIRNLFRSSKSAEINRFMVDILNLALNQLFDHLADGRQVKEEDRQLIIHFYRHAITGFTAEWFNHHSGEDPAPLVARLSRLLQGSMRQAIIDAAEK